LAATSQSKRLVRKSSVMEPLILRVIDAA
jgi:hypothetical protein